MDQTAILYVSPMGNDSESGTREAPLATLKAAIEKAKETGVKTIKLLEGIYKCRDTVVLDSTLAGFTIEGEGDVLFSGGEHFPSDAVKPAEKNEVSARFPDLSRVKMLDLSGISIGSEFLGRTVTDARFFIGNGIYENARYPHNARVPGQDGDYALSTHVNINKENTKLTLYYDGEEIREHMKRWDPSVYDEMMIRGYIWTQWDLAVYTHISIGDPEKGIVCAKPGCGYESIGDSSGTLRRTFLSNIPEELENPGEHYYDRKNKVLYFIPADDSCESPVVSVCDQPVFKVEGTENVTIRGIRFSYFRRDVFVGKGASDMKIENCEFSHLSARAITLYELKDFVIDGCDFFDIAAGCVFLNESGDRYHLIPSGIRIHNCTFRDYNRFETCGRSAIYLVHVCGVTISQNTFSDTPHSCLFFVGFNDILVEDNVFRNVCRDTDDAAVIYWGRNPSDLGGVIRGNYFEKAGNDFSEYNVAAIYLDDYTVCPQITDNIFYDCSSLTREKQHIHTNTNAIVLNNAQYLNVTNNLFIEKYPDQKPVNLYPCPSESIWRAYVYSVDGVDSPTGDLSWFELLKNHGFFTETWRRHYEHTVWAPMFDLVPENAHDLVEQYYAEHDDPNDPDSHRKNSSALKWQLLNESWNHIDEEGNPYPGTLRSYTEQTHPELFEEDSDFNPFDLKTKGGAFIFWRVVDYKWVLSTTNVYENNVSVGMCRDYLTEDGKLKGHVMNGFQNNYNPETEILPDGRHMFVKYGEDFTFTPEGLAEVRKHLPSFHNIVLHAGAIR